METSDRIARCAAGLLARREHSRAELAGKLRSRFGDTLEVVAVLDRFEGEQLLSDRRYAEEFVRVKSPKMGPLRIRSELRAKGVSAELVEEAMEILGGDDDAIKRAVECLRRKCMAGRPDAKERARRHRFLLGRGFPGHVVRRAVDAYAAEGES